MRKDLRDWRILKEGDAECCSYYHLREFLKADRSWRVFARKYSRKTRFYTDLAIYRDEKARIAIEIKWRKKHIPKKDRKALASARKKLKFNGRRTVRKTYFYCVMPDASEYKKLPSEKKTRAEKYRLFERVVGLGYSNKQRIEEWLLQRKKFRPKK